MVYVDTPREFWRWKQTIPRFAGSTALLGLALGTFGSNRSGLLFGAVAAAAILKLALELTIFRHIGKMSSHALQRTARLMAGELSRAVLFRVSTLVIAIVLCAITFVLEAAPSTFVPALLFAVLLVSELAERYLFFTAVAQPKMPGGLV
jgi:DMSO reductase anchor subunit